MLRPADIDFPVSPTFAKGLNELHGWGLDMEWEDPEPDWWIELQQRWVQEEIRNNASPEPENRYGKRNPQRIQRGVRLPDGF
ncbi:hypothetical protein ACFLU3_02100 [Chloroflexota bacterium]